MNTEPSYNTECDSEQLKKSIMILEWDLKNIKRHDILSCKMRQLKEYKAALEGLKKAQ